MLFQGPGLDIGENIGCGVLEVGAIASDRRRVRWWKMPVMLLQGLEGDTSGFVS